MAPLCGTVGPDSGPTVERSGRAPGAQKSVTLSAIALLLETVEELIVDQIVGATLTDSPSPVSAISQPVGRSGVSSPS
jgi:hypothetical protein